MGLYLPFGENSCEQEVGLLGKDYQEYYFDHAPFHEDALDSEKYLIVGRRGSGKTSLLHYFNFQSRIKSLTCIEKKSADLPCLYADIQKNYLSKSSITQVEVLIPKLAKLWDVIIWSMLFSKFQDINMIVKQASLLESPRSSLINIIRRICEGLVKKFAGIEGDVLDAVIEKARTKTFLRATDIVLNYVVKRPVIIAIDSLEHFSLHDTSMMCILAALVECASQINLRYAKRGIQIKLCITDEIYPHLVESIVSNPSKVIRNPVFLHWRPKDLIRLLCWRYCKYSSAHQEIIKKSEKVYWEKFDEVKNGIWEPLFGKTIVNKYSRIEPTFPYVLRYTQMKPREAIHYCNEIMKVTEQEKTYPKIIGNHVIKGVDRASMDLSSQILNSYEQIYPNVPEIVDALVGMKMLFKGKALDKVAPRTAAGWPLGDYSSMKFRQLLCELGIVGRVRKIDKKNKIIAADFEYFMNDRLVVNEGDDCVIHPMFYTKLNVKTSEGWIVYPFPDHPSYEEALK